MTSPLFDVAVVGLGAMGSAAAFHLARRGQQVLGLDRYAPPHELGSSHGQTRIIREAYFEHPAYVPLVQRAYQLWEALQQQTGRALLLPTGGLTIGKPNGVQVSGALRSAEIHHLPHEVLSAAQVRQRFPALNPDPDMVAIWEPRAGILFPEACIESHLELARQHGAHVLTNQAVLGWQAEANGVRLFGAGREFRARHLLMCAGAWMTQLVPDLQLPLSVERQVLFWFAPRADQAHFAPARCPISLWEYEPGHSCYAFPDLGEGVKIARHHQGELTVPDSVRREVDVGEVEAMRPLLQRYLPKADGACVRSAVCLYTNTPDFHFLIDVHPRYQQVVIASPCSGHGFKFASAIGELLADLVLTGKTDFDVSLFKLKRFTV